MTVGAAGIEDSSVGSAGLLLQRHLPVGEGVVSNELVGGERRPHVEDEGDEEKQDPHHKQCSFEPIDLVGKGLLAVEVLQHFLEGLNSSEW